MMMTERTEKLIGINGVKRLKESHVLVLGLGGVGGCVFEMLVRAGVGKITAVDGDVFEESNINRQILCTYRDLGKPKAEVAKARAKLINPACEVRAVSLRYGESTRDQILIDSYDYAADCIDSVRDKTDFILECRKRGVPVISAMGAGNRLTADFTAADIFSTSGDGLARVMRKKLRDEGVTELEVVYSQDAALGVDGAVGSISYAPNAAGCTLAQRIILGLLCK